MAEAFHNWLPTIIQQVEPWMSEHDIDKGTRGLPAIAQQLEETQFGLICLTHESMNAPWLLFEAGALSKSQDQSRVWTVLYKLEYAEVKGPLAQFQHTKIERDDVSKLLQAINTAGGNPLLKEPQLETAFRRGWPELEHQLQEIPEAEETSPDRSEKDMIKEVLEIVRIQAIERRQNAHEADKFMAAYLSLVLNAERQDTNFKDSEFSQVAEELQESARARLLGLTDVTSQQPQRTRWLKFRSSPTSYTSAGPGAAQSLASNLPKQEGESDSSSKEGRIDEK